MRRMGYWPIALAVGLIVLISHYLKLFPSIVMLNKMQNVLEEQCK